MAEQSKRQYDPYATQERILQAACELFIEHDCMTVSLGQIAERAGLAPSQINYHFRSKRQLRIEVFLRVFNEYGAEQIELLKEVGPETVEKSIRLYFGFFRKYPSFCTLMCELLQESRDGNVRNWPLPVLAAGSQGFAEGQRTGLLHRHYPPQFFMIAMISLVTHWFEGRHVYLPYSGLKDELSSYDQAYLDFIVRIFNQGITALPDNYEELLAADQLFESQDNE